MKKRGLCSSVACPVMTCGTSGTRACRRHAACKKGRKEGHDPAKPDRSRCTFRRCPGLVCPRHRVRAKQRSTRLKRSKGGPHPQEWLQPLRRAAHVALDLQQASAVQAASLEGVPEEVIPQQRHQRARNLHACTHASVHARMQVARTSWLTHALVQPCDACMQAPASRHSLHRMQLLPHAAGYAARGAVMAKVSLV